MAKSESIHCLELIDFFNHPLIFPLANSEKLLMNYCIKQGAKNNLGIFREYRGAISMKLQLEHEIVHDFFLKNPELITFDQKTHFIWIKPFYEFIEFGLQNPLQREIKNKKNKEIEIGLDKRNLFIKNAFISKIKASFRQNPELEIFKNDWVRHNFTFLSRLNEQVKSVANNRHNIDALLQTY